MASSAELREVFNFEIVSLFAEGVMSQNTAQLSCVRAAEYSPAQVSPTTDVLIEQQQWAGVCLLTAKSFARVL